MIDLIQRLLPFCVATAGLGVALGALLGGGDNALSARRTVLVATSLLLLAATGLSLAGLVPGRPGLWLDIAVTLAIPYGLGCVAGAGSRWAIGRGRVPGKADAPMRPAPPAPPQPAETSASAG